MYIYEKSNPKETTAPLLPLSPLEAPDKEAGCQDPGLPDI